MRNAGTQVTNSSVQVWAAPSCICMHTSTSETKENIPEDPNGEVSYISRMCHLQQKKITFSSPLRVPRTFQLGEAYGLKTLLECLNIEKLNFFYNSRAQKFSFSLNISYFFFSQSMWLPLNITKFRKYMGLLYNIV